MAIITLDNIIASAKQKIALQKTVARATVATGYYSMFDLAGNPGAGTLAGANTANGVVPTDAVAGYPVINPFGVGNTGYIGRLEYADTVAARIVLYDRLFVAGAYNFNANTALTGQPSYVGRLPNGDYKNLEIWVEQVAIATGNQAVNVTYTNEAGVAGRTTGAVGIGAAPAQGRCWQLPLQAGDQGVQQITNVAGSVASAGTFNVMVLRRLCTVRTRLANDGGILNALDLGMPQVFDTSAFYFLIAADSTSTGIPDLFFDVING